MKKIFVTLSLVLLSFSSFIVSAQSPDNSIKIEKNRQYIELPKYAYPEREVIEIFSFNCPSCYLFAIKYNVIEKIDQNLPQGMKVKLYHLDNFGPLAKELTEAWAIASVLGIEYQVKEALFKGIHETINIKTADDIKAIFNDFGVDNNKYESMKNNFLVKSFMTAQSEAIKELQPIGIPSFYVNRKYVINSQGLNTTSNEAFINEYSQVINYLLNK